MGICSKCKLEHTSTTHTDGQIVVKCLEQSCSHVEIERYGSKRWHIQKTEAEEAAERVEG